MKRLSIFLPLLCLMACTQYNDIETVVQIQERNISSELVEQTRQQLIGRLQSTGFQNVQVEQGKSPIELIISTKIEEENDVSHKRYHNLLRKGELGIWHTYRPADPEIMRIMATVPEISGLELNHGQYSYVVFAGAAHADSLQIAKQRLEKHFADFSNLRFLWSPKPNSYSGAYQLYAIDTRGSSTAPITNEHIGNAGVDYDGSRKIYTVNMTMNREGTELWSQMTRRELKREIAMVLDDKVYSAPTVQSQITNGRTEITGNFTPDEAVRLSDLLGASPLPYTLKIIDEKITSQE